MVNEPSERPKRFKSRALFFDSSEFTELQSFSILNKPSRIFMAFYEKRTILSFNPCKQIDLQRFYMEINKWARQNLANRA